MSRQNYSRRTCYISGCGTGSKRQEEDRVKAGRKEVYRFCVPRDPELQSIWWDAIPVHKREFRKGDFVCSLHFKEEEIEMFYETLMPNGYVHRIPRRPRLKKYSVPTLNLHGYVTEVGLDTKICDDYLFVVDTTQPYCLRSALKVTSQFKENSMEENEESNISTSILPNEDTDIDLQEDCLQETFSFSSLAKNLGGVKTPDHQWTLSNTPLFIICAKWDGDFNAERRLVIDRNLKARVYLKHQEILSKLNVDVSINSVDDLSNLLLEVHQFKMCIGLEDLSSRESCLVYVGQTSSHLCLSCQAYYKLYGENYNSVQAVESLQEANKDLNAQKKQYERKIQRFQDKSKLVREKMKCLQMSLTRAETKIKKQRRKILEHQSNMKILD